MKIAQNIILIITIFASLFLSATAAEKLLEPTMSITIGGITSPQVALTLDACSGKIDKRILKVLIDNKIHATIFITGRWIKSNPKTIKIFNQHKNLFQLENHGASHIPAVLGSERPYGIKPAGTPTALLKEVNNGNLAIQLISKTKPQWFRGATALYSPAAIDLIKQTNHRIAGFSLNADFGASASANTAASRVASAKDGDVIIAHINQPTRAAGAGIAKGILALQAKGFRFVRLDEVEVTKE